MAEFTQGQKDVLALGTRWWKSRDKQIFEVAGYAGTGKSFIVKHLIESLGIEQDNVRFITYTGKASLVLTKNGTPATTVHSLIYRLETFKEPVLDEKGSVIDYNVKERFVKVESISKNIELIVVDEGSMINDDMWDDIASYNKPIIVLGDPGQLPPIYGSTQVLKNPDVVLDEIVRQAEGSRIIQLATMARKGIPLELDTRGTGGCFVLPNNANLTDKIYTGMDIILTTTRKRRRVMNDLVRDLKGYDGLFPNQGEKIICRKNNRDIIEHGFSLTNGNF